MSGGTADHAGDPKSFPRSEAVINAIELGVAHCEWTAKTQQIPPWSETTLPRQLLQRSNAAHLSLGEQKISPGLEL